MSMRDGYMSSPRLTPERVSESYCGKKFNSAKAEQDFNPFGIMMSYEEDVGKEEKL